MPRKPNYKFERFERDRQKADKKAARLQAKVDRRGKKDGDDGTAEVVSDDTAAAPEATDTEKPATD